MWVYVDPNLCIFGDDDGVDLEAMCQVDDEQERAHNFQMTHLLLPFVRFLTSERFRIYGHITLDSCLEFTFFCFPFFVNDVSLSREAN